MYPGFDEHAGVVDVVRMRRNPPFAPQRWLSSVSWVLVPTKPVRIALLCRFDAGDVAVYTGFERRVGTLCQQVGDPPDRLVHQPVVPRRPRVAADIACARCYEVEIFESVDAAREMRRVVPFELVEHVADGDMFPFFIAGAPEGVFDPDASGLQRPGFLQSRSPGCTLRPGAAGPEVRF